MEPDAPKRRRRRGGRGRNSGASATATPKENNKPEPEAVNEPASFLQFVIDHRLGTEVTGIVDAFASHGAFINVDGVRCYIPLSAMGEPQPSRARDVLTKDETRTFVVQAVDAPRRGIELGLPGFATVAGAPSEETVAAEVGTRRRGEGQDGRNQGRLAQGGHEEGGGEGDQVHAAQSSRHHRVRPEPGRPPEPPSGPAGREGRGTQQTPLPKHTPAPGRGAGPRGGAGRQTTPAKKTRAKPAPAAEPATTKKTTTKKTTKPATTKKTTTKPATRQEDDRQAREEGDHQARRPRRRPPSRRRRRPPSRRRPRPPRPAVTTAVAKAPAKAAKQQPAAKVAKSSKSSRRR